MPLNNCKILSSISFTNVKYSTRLANHMILINSFYTVTSQTFDTAFANFLIIYILHLWELAHVFLSSLLLHLENIAYSMMITGAVQDFLKSAHVLCKCFSASNLLLVLMHNTELWYYFGVFPLIRHFRFCV